MTIDELVRNPYFDTYVKLMRELHALIRQGEDESDAGDALRDQLDHPWYQLGQEERDVAGNLSGDLYAIGDERQPVSRDSVPPELSKQVHETYGKRDWLELLRLLRTKEMELPAADVAYFRGICWSHLKQPAIAADFFTEATRLDPTNPTFDIHRLRALIQADRLEEAAGRAEAIARDGGNWLQHVLAAQVMLLRSQHAPGFLQSELLQFAIRLAEKSTRLAAEAAAEEQVLIPKYQAKSHIICSLAYEQLEKHAEALAACNSALELEPANADALLIRSWLTHLTNPTSAKGDFLQGIVRHGMLVGDEAFPTLSDVAMSN